jgi:hypothetical protein
VKLYVMVNDDQALIGFYAINAQAVHDQGLPTQFARARPGHASIPAFIAMISAIADQTLALLERR